MSRKLIDRDALIASIPKTNVDIFENCRNCSTLCDWQVRKLIEQAELVDAVEVKRGEWITGFYPSVGTHCDNCGWAWSDHIDAVKLNPTLSRIKTNYCPNCGASMDGEEQADERM